MKIRPMSNNMLVKRLEEPNKTPGGIFLPDSVVRGEKGKPVRGKVFAIGKGKLAADGLSLSPMESKVGDVIIYPEYAAVKTKVDGEDFELVRDEDVFAVIEE